LGIKEHCRFRKVQFAFVFWTEEVAAICHAIVVELAGRPSLGNDLKMIVVNMTSLGLSVLTCHISSMGCFVTWPGSEGIPHGDRGAVEQRFTGYEFDEARRKGMDFGASTPHLNEAFASAEEECSRFLRRRRHSNDLYITLGWAKYSFSSSFPVYEEAAPGSVTSFGVGTNLFRLRHRVRLRHLGKVMSNALIYHRASPLLAHSEGGQERWAYSVGWRERLKLSSLHEFRASEESRYHYSFVAIEASVDYLSAKSCPVLRNLFLD